MNKSINLLAIKRFGVYDLIISLLVITSLAFYDIKILFLATQGVAFLFTLFVLTKQNKVGKVDFSFLCWLGMFVVYSFTSLLWASSANTTALMCTFSVLQVGLIAFCILVYCNTKERKQNIILTFIVSSIAISLRFFITVPPSLWGQMSRFSKDSIFGGNTPAMILSFSVIFLSYALAFQKPRGLKKITCIVFIVLFSLIAFLMGTKMGLAMMVLGIGLIYISGTKNPVKLVKRIFVILIAISVLYYLIMNVSFLYGSIGYRIDSMLSGFLGNETDASTENRSFYAVDALSVFMNNFVLGVGQDGYRYVNSRDFTYSHNNYVEILANLGIIGFVIFYSLFVKLFFRSWKNRKNNYLPFVLVIIMLLLGVSQVFYSNEMSYIIIAIIITLLKKDECEI